MDQEEISANAGRESDSDSTTAIAKAIKKTEKTLLTYSVWNTLHLESSGTIET